MNKKVEQQDFENYLQEARTWETDKNKELKKSAKLGWIFAAVASGVAVMSSTAAVVMAFAWMNPAPPPVIRVNETTGTVDLVSTIKDARTTYEEAVNKYFTQLYVRYREGYSKPLAEEYYSNVGIMSSGLEQQKYFAYFNPKTPTSPLNVYGEYAKVKIIIKGTSFISPNVALVRYTKAVERGNDKPQLTHWAATIAFKYSGAPMAEKDRAINPLGFQVTEYRNDPDSGVIPDADSAPAAPAPISAATPAVTVFPTSTPVVPAVQQ